MNHHLRRGATVAAALLGTVVALAGPAALAADATETHATDTHTAVAAAASVPACTAGDVALSYRRTDAGMSHTYGRLVVRNTSGAACSLHGFGGLSYVGHGNGTQVGTAADRDPGTAVRTVVLQPGRRAHSAVTEAAHDVFPAGLCDPVRVDGFRVYLPGETHALFLAHRTQGCSVTASHQLGHQAFTH